MTRKSTVAKKRLDKYYHLAKEQGFRSRAAFKLIQLNKKYDFLGSSRTLLDLCAAPGGWLQVAAKYMPISSQIVGIDLYPIKSIPHVLTYEEDITTPKCRDILRKAFQKMKIDVVLHDGSPNVGVAWDQDAYSQSELVLSSLKLATEFLKQGGMFITKVFRSRDYNSLLWVFNQLFSRVESTKPQASRNESAEIYVVCKGFLAPKYIDPKFLDAKHVFKDLDIPTKINILSSKAKVNRSGYEEGNVTLFKRCSVAEFIESRSPINVLSSYNQFVFDEAAQKYKDNLYTTGEIINLVEDIKLLSKRDFKVLLKWRNRILKEKEEEEKANKVVEEPEKKILSPEEEEANLDNELSEKLTYIQMKERKQKKKLQKKKIKQQYRKDMKMDLNMSKDDVLVTPQELGLFVPPTESTVASMGLEVTTPLEMLLFDKSPEFLPKPAAPKIKLVDPFVEKLAFAPKDDDEGESYQQLNEKYFDFLYDQYINVAFKKTKKRLKAEHTPDLKKALKRREKKEALEQSMSIFEGVQSTKKVYPDLPPELQPDLTKTVYEEVAEEEEKKKNKKEDDDDEDQDADNEQEDDDEEEEEEKEQLISKYQELQPSYGKDFKLPAIETEKRTSLWFSQPIFDDLITEEDKQDQELLKKKETLQKEILKEQEKENHPQTKKRTRSDKKLRKEAKKKKKQEDSDNEDFEVVAQNIHKPVQDSALPPGSDSDYDSDDKKDVLALATVAVRQGKLSEIVDDAYNRFAWNDHSQTPKWFADNEKKHNVPQLPVTKEIVNEIKERFKEINARPMQKVAEAKARKKNKIDKKLAKLRTKANAIAESQDLPESSKLKQIQKMYAKTKLDPKKQTKFVVRKKFQTRSGTSSRGTKSAKSGGKTKIVDRRMKKEKRALDRKNAKTKSGPKKKNFKAKGGRRGGKM